MLTATCISVLEESSQSSVCPSAMAKPSPPQAARSPRFKQTPRLLAPDHGRSRALQRHHFEDEEQDAASALMSASAPDNRWRVLPPIKGNSTHDPVAESQACPSERGRRRHLRKYHSVPTTIEMRSAVPPAPCAFVKDVSGTPKDEAIVKLTVEVCFSESKPPDLPFAVIIGVTWKYSPQLDNEYEYRKVSPLSLPPPALPVVTLGVPLTGSGILCRCINRRHLRKSTRRVDTYLGLLLAESPLWHRPREGNSRYR